MLLIHAPEALPDGYDNFHSIFMAGSIEMGKAEDWQTKFTEGLNDKNVIIYNPRRPDWDSSWEQKIENPQFNEQVNWELDNLLSANLVVFYFQPDTMSPITLMELGAVSDCNRRQHVIVCCPEGFWRKGNVDIICQRNGIKMVDTLEELINESDHIINTLESWFM